MHDMLGIGSFMVPRNEIELEEYFMELRFDLSRSPIEIPRAFWNVRYNGDHYPGAEKAHGVSGGANCQQYAYSVLRHYGFLIPDFRSSELWADVEYTEKGSELTPFGLILVHDKPESFGAHVGLCLGMGLVLHLSKKLDRPAIESLAEMQSREEYCCLIGTKIVVPQLQVHGLHVE